MEIASMFKRLLRADPATVTILIEGDPVEVAAGDTVAAAVLGAGLASVRTTPVSGTPRAPYCLMGVCFDCLMEIDGIPNRQSCMVRVQEGMQVRRQHGAASVGFDGDDR
jgi:predicted molibdopterin-dependent oxidoreductase YjgC